MASSSSLKDLSKAINSFIADPKLPLPDSLTTTIDSYLEKHERAADEAASDRLQEELETIFEKHVRQNPNTTGPWMGILRRLQPALQSAEKVLFWFDACLQILDTTPLDKGVVKETVQAMMNTVKVAEFIQESYEGELNPIIDRLFSIWLDKFYTALAEGNKSIENNEKLLRDALVHFGKRRPKEFFLTLNNYFVMKQYRKPVLMFFADYIQSQPPHLHQVAQTPLFEHLLTCLQRDTSTTIVAAALTSLIMLLPHMPSALVPHLPTLFNIYARLLFWDRERTGAIELPSHESEEKSDWEVCVYDTSTEGLFVGNLSQYYTMLYGLYPINFMDYIRKPQRYLRHANISNADDIEVQPTEIRHQSELFRRCHLLHPNFYTLTIESEKTDFSRWIKCDAAEVVTECIGLCTTTETEQFVDNGSVQEPRSPDAAQFPGRKKSDPLLLSNSVSKVDSWRNAQFASLDGAGTSNMIRRASHSSQRSNRDGNDFKLRQNAESPTPLTQSPSHTQLQDLIKSNKAIKSGLHQSLANESVASLTLSHPDSAADRSIGQSMPPPPIPHSSDSPAPTSDFRTQISYLQNQVLLLQTELRFERYLKQQHITHIGDLRSRQVEEAATEAETQNLIMMNRSLKSRYEDAKKAEMQVRKESEKSRAMVKNREADFQTKMRNLREESKKTHAELDNVKEELEIAKTERLKLRNMLSQAEVRELSWKQNTQSIEIHGAEVDRLKAEVERLTLSERDNQARELARDEAINQASQADTKILELKMQLDAQRREVERTKTLFQSQVAALQEQLSDAQEERSRPNGSAYLAVEGALAASRAKQAELQKQNDLLLRKYKVLQSSLLDMNSAPPFSAEPSRSQDAELNQRSKISSPTSTRPRTNRTVTGPEERHEGELVTSPIDGRSGPAISGGSHQPISPQRKDSSVTQPHSRSPEQRYFGGLSSRMRKESSDKAKESKEDGASLSGKSKKDKKSGLRGIRGLVG